MSAASQHRNGRARSDPLNGHQEQTVRLAYASAVALPSRNRERRPPSAVVFLPHGTPSAGRWTDTCGEYIQRRGYRLAAFATVWADVVRMVLTGAADVVVVGRRDHLPPDRTPRVEIITDSAPAADRQRRPQRRR